MDSQEAVAAENIMLLIEFCHGIRHTLKMVGYFRIFSPGQPAVLLSERQESFDSVCCRHAGSGVTRPCIRTSEGLAFTEKRDNLQSVLGILNSKEDMEADSNQ